MNGVTVEKEKEIREALKRAYVNFLASTSALVLAWKANLSDEQLAELADKEAHGLHPGLSIAFSAKENQWVTTVDLVDAAGGSVPLDTINIAFSGASVTIN